MHAPANNTRDRFDSEGDEIARHFFSDADLHLAPEEYAARHAQDWALFSLHLYRYRDPILGAWVRRLGEILFSQDEVERCRQRYLTSEELAVVRRREAEPF